MSTTAEKPKPFLLPEYCKGCGRCIEACARHCIEMGTEINPQTGPRTACLIGSALNGSDAYRIARDNDWL